MNSPHTLKVCHLSSVHPSNCVRIFFRECLALKRRGYDVSFVVPEQSDEIRQGVAIRAVKRPTSRRDRFLVTTSKVLRRALQEKADVYHFHDPDLIPLGFLLRLMGKKVIYDVHEDLPGSILDKEWIPHWLRRPVSLGAETFEWLSGQAFSGIVAATPKIAERFPESKTATVQNFPIHREWASKSVVPFAERPKEVLYAGIVTAARGVREMVEAMGLLPAESPARLRLVGTFYPDSLRLELEKAPGWKRVDFHPWVERTELGNFMTRAYAGLVLFHPLRNHTESQPNKIFEYMSAGIPLIASDFPLWRSIIAKHECGILINPENPRELVRAMTFLFENPDKAEAMGVRGRQAIQEIYNWDVESKNLLGLYDRLVQ